jgi:hypothetical protein
LLHTVLFHRALGVVRPKDVQLSLFEDVIFVRAPRSRRACLRVLRCGTHVDEECARAPLGGDAWRAQAQCDDAELERVVETRITEFCEWVEKHPERRDVTVRRVSSCLGLA